MYTHGLAQSQAVTDTAQALSKAKDALKVARANFFAMPDDGAGPVLLAAFEQDVENAQAAYNAAYKVYTNPFGVVKTFS